MKKLKVTSLVTLSVGLALVTVGGVLRSINFDTSVFNPATLASAMFTVGYLMAVLSGVLLTGSAVVGAIKGGEAKKLMLTTVIIAAVGLTMVLTAAVLGTITTWGTTTGTFNPTNTNALNTALNTIGYLSATLSGVVLVATAVATVTKQENSK